MQKTADGKILVDWKDGVNRGCWHSEEAKLWRMDFEGT
jgi:hypothetical protein